MSIIEASMVRCKTMADGSLRLECEVEPRNAQAAFALFGAPGRAVALAALKDGAAKVAEPEKPKGGEWAKLAGMWCADPDFWLWANQQGHSWVTTSGTAGQFMREMCMVDSRVAFDNDEDALARFNETIRLPFMEWMKARGIRK